MELSFRNLVWLILIILLLQWICIIFPTMYKMKEVRPSVENRKLMVATDGTSVTVPEIEPKSKQQNNTWSNIVSNIDNKDKSKVHIEQERGVIGNITRVIGTNNTSYTTGDIGTDKTSYTTGDIGTNNTSYTTGDIGTDKTSANVDSENDTKDSIFDLVDDYLEKEGIEENRKGELLNNRQNDTCAGCKTFNFKQSTNSWRCLYMPNNHLQILFLIMSRPSDWEARKALRGTYLSGLKGKPVNYVFVIGRSEDYNIEQRVIGESFYFGDILKFDFIDSYENLTIKSISSFQWASRSCQQARYVMKLDDDVWVNINALLTATKSSSFIKYIGCYCYNGAVPVRERKHKHFIAKEEYPGETFPPYCNGPSYIMTRQTVLDIGSVASYVPYVHIEDVFIGICLKRLNYSVDHNYKFHRFEGFRHSCYYKSKDVYTFHQLPPYAMSIIWKANCSASIDYSRYVPKKYNNQNEKYNFTDFSNRKMCHNCFNFKYPLLIENDVCPNNLNNRIVLFLLIFSRPSNAGMRLTIRNTYLTPFRNRQSIVRYAFVLGNGHDSKINDMLEWENKYFHDILKFNFDDTYLNLTLKTLNGLDWVTKNCKSANYILKIDDDVWFNTFAFFFNLNKKKLEFSSIGGDCHSNGAPVRDPRSKYYISPQSYPHFNFPPFCMGPSYILQQHVAKDIVNISRDVPFFQLEDVYVGMCLHHLHYKVTSIPSFLPYTIYQFPCWFRSNQVLTFHSLSDHFMREVWHTDCSKFFERGIKLETMRRQIIDKSNRH